jgi:RNA polymerase sigma-70 factor (ECF subfamily)
VRRACTRRLRDVIEAEEVAQAAFVRALERIDRCGGERRFGAWVQVIAQRLCIDLLRAQTRTTPREDPLAGDREVGPNTPEDRALDIDTAATLRVALATLPPRQRDVVIARDVEERRPPEIAAAFGLTVGAVDSLLLRARRRLAGAYRAAAGEQGISTTASSAAVAGGTVAAGTRGLRDAIVAGARALRDVVPSVSAALTASPAASAAAAPSTRRTAAAAIAAALTLAGGGIAIGHAPTRSAPELRVPAPTTVPLPALPPPPSSAVTPPVVPDVADVVPVVPPVAVSPTTVPPDQTWPAPPPITEVAPVPVAQTVTAVTNGIVSTAGALTSTVGATLGALTR